VIHLEVPWTPLRVEQRIGRVDRLGQERGVHSVHLLAAGTGEELMAMRLAERSRKAEDVLAGGRMPESAPASCVDATLLERECRHLAVARELDKRAARIASLRPFQAVRRRHGGHSIVGLRLAFVDAEGLLVWESFVGVTLPSDADAGLMIEPETLAETVPVRMLAESELYRLREALAPIVHLAIARDAAIARTLEEQRARLSALVLQPRLFDRRYERARSAQHELLRHALVQVDAHRARLAPLGSVRLDQVRHAFSLFARRR
jgi:hypothetical protein